MTHWAELGAINSAEHEFTRPLDWRRHLMRCPCRITVSFYDHTHTHQQPLFLLHIQHTTICSGDSVTLATGDVITPLPYRLSLWPSNRLHQCLCWWAWYLICHPVWGEQHLNDNVTSLDTSLRYFGSIFIKLGTNVCTNTGQVRAWQTHLWHFREQRCKLGCVCSAARTGRGQEQDEYIVK